MSNRDWLPEAESPLLDLIDIWEGEGLANPVYKTQFNWPDADCAATLTKMAVFKSARASYETDNSSARRIARDNAKKAATGSMRDFANQHIRFNPKIPPEIKATLLRREADPVKTPFNVEDKRAIIGELKALGGFAVEIRFHDEDSPTRRAILEGCNGCLLYFFVGDEKIDDYQALTEHTLMTTDPYHLHLGPEAEGKWLSCAIRWQSKTARLGEWSGVEHVRVI